MLTAILLGLMLGSWGPNIWLWVFPVTRPYRVKHNSLLFVLGFTVIVLSIFIPLLIAMSVVERIGISRAPEGDALVMAYTVGCAVPGSFALLSEFKWRKSI